MIVLRYTDAIASTTSFVVDNERGGWVLDPTPKNAARFASVEDAERAARRWSRRRGYVLNIRRLALGDCTRYVEAIDEAAL